MFKLFDGLPLTAENFRALCTGEKGYGRNTGKRLYFKDTIFHRIIPNFMIQGGDLSHLNGRGGESIYGGRFDDEAFSYSHDRPGLLSCANAGKDTNGSQFFITLAKAPHLDGKHVVFGEVVSGMGVLSKIASVSTDTKDCPLPSETVKIDDCGEIGGQRTKEDDKGRKRSQSPVAKRHKKKDKKKKHKHDKSPKEEHVEPTGEDESLDKQRSSHKTWCFCRLILYHSSTKTNGNCQP